MVQWVSEHTTAIYNGRRRWALSLTVGAWKNVINFAANFHIVWALNTDAASVW